MSHGAAVRDAPEDRLALARGVLARAERTRHEEPDPNALPVRPRWPGCSRGAGCGRGPRWRYRSRAAPHRCCSHCWPRRRRRGRGWASSAAPISGWSPPPRPGSRWSGSRWCRRPAPISWRSPWRCSTGWTSSRGPRRARRPLRSGAERAARRGAGRRTAAAGGQGPAARRGARGAGALAGRRPGAALLRPGLDRPHRRPRPVAVLRHRGAPRRARLRRARSGRRACSCPAPRDGRARGWSACRRLAPIRVAG